MLSTNDLAQKSTFISATLQSGRRFLHNAYLPLAAILLGVNVMLGVMLHRTHAEVTRLKEMRNVPLGQSLPPVVGTRLTGESVTLRPGSGSRKPALLFVLSPSCPACTRAWPSWDNLRRQTSGISDHVFLDVSGSMDVGYATQHGIADSVITKLMAPPFSASASCQLPS